MTDFDPLEGPRHVCVVTGSRAEYGLLRWLMQEIAADEALALQVVVTGMHLAPAHGLTYREIEKDGFVIDAKVEMLLDSDSAAAVTKSLGLGIIGLADAFERLAPDLVVLLGDRFETLGAAQAAYLARIPIAHLHGGEITEGALDDALRHAITKLAALHFVAAEPFRQRVIQLGEQPERVEVVGAPGLDALESLTLPGRQDLEAELGLDLGRDCLLVTYHPETLSDLASSDAIGELLAALNDFQDCSVVFTRPNADPGNRPIVQAIEAWAETRPGRAWIFDSLGQRRYLGLLAQAAAVVGNSSSALIEAPALETPSVNIGDRQKGRPRASSVLDCACERGAIVETLRRALSPEFRQACKEAALPYGKPGAAKRIAEVLRTVDLADLRRKVFHDLPGADNVVPFEAVR